MSEKQNTSDQAVRVSERLPTEYELESLLETRGYPCVSMYIPRLRLAKHVRRARLRAQLREVKDLLPEHHADVVRPLAKFCRGAFEQRGEGLAVFCQGDELEVFPLARETEMLSFVDDHFHVLPLLAQVSAPTLYVLRVSRRRPALYRVGATTTRIPLSSTLEHPSLPQDRRERGKREAREDADLRRFVTSLDEEVARHVRDEDLLVLAGVDELTALLRRSSRVSASITDEQLSGNHDATSTELLADAARARVAAAPGVIATARDEVEQLAHTSRVIASVDDVVRAAHDGQVETLFVERKRRQWGELNRRSQAVTLEATQGPYNEELYDLAARQTYSKGGTVFTVPASDMPLAQPIVALLRY